MRTRAADWRKQVVVLWSGGIDSTALVAQLAVHGYHILALSLTFGGSVIEQRERDARARLLPPLKDVSAAHGGSLETACGQGGWLFDLFGNDGEVPTRNKRMIDYLIAKHLVPRGLINLGLGEYVGVDTWVVRDHVGGADCDHRSLAAYIWHEYGADYRLLSLADFGESRYKCDRLRIGVEACGAEVMGSTTNCLHNQPRDCGRCYKCAERHAAFTALDLDDPTPYLQQPLPEQVMRYLKQFSGADVSVPIVGF